jgi:TatD DNase family protein
MLVDTHIHLEHRYFSDDREAVMARAKEAGVGVMILPGADPKDLPAAVALCEAHEHLFFAAGVHPCHAAVYDEAAIAAYLSHPKCVAVGECGLDYYHLPKDPDQKAATKAEQRGVFEAQIALAVEHGLPLIVHIRDSSEDSLAVLQNSRAGEVGGVLHCFNGDEQLLKLAEKGFYYGIGGVFTFKNARKLPEIVPQIPRDRLLLETDSPYLTPHPHRGTRNEPAYTRLIADALADKLQMDPKALDLLTTQNASACFNRLQGAIG